MKLLACGLPHKKAALGGFFELQQNVICSLGNAGNFTPENRGIDTHGL